MRIERAILKYNNKIVEILANKKVFEDELYVDFSVTDAEYGQRLQVTIHPKQTVTINYLAIELYHSYQPKERIFCNGFQSWTESREFAPNEKIEPVRSFVNEKIEPVRSFVKSRIGTFGDYDFCEYPNREGCLHSWSYTYIRTGEEFALIGSLNEFTGYTLFR